MRTTFWQRVRRALGRNCEVRVPAWLAALLRASPQERIVAAPILAEEVKSLRRRVIWLERNSQIRTPSGASIHDYVKAMEAGEEETPCPHWSHTHQDGQHCNCWYDGGVCCACGDPAKPVPPFPITPAPLSESGEERESVTTEQPERAPETGGTSERRRR